MPATVTERKGLIRRIMQVFIPTCMWGALLFVAAGTIRWWQAWLYMALFLLSLAANGVAMARYNPGLAAERSKAHTGTKPFDRIFAILYVSSLFILPVVAGLDAERFGWSVWTGAWSLCVGALFHVVGTIPVTWAMATNRYLETTVRIQNDKGHRVVSSGPYRYIRHPMYAGAILMMIAVPLILGSAWALVPALAIAALFVARTALEDRTLRAELPGYAAYASRTRYRLFPGLW